MWLNIAAKLVPGMIKTGMKIATNRRKAKELESIAEMNHAQRMADGQIEYKKAVMNNQNQGWKDELVLIIVVFGSSSETDFTRQLSTCVSRHYRSHTRSLTVTRVSLHTRLPRDNYPTIFH